MISKTLYILFLVTLLGLLTVSMVGGNIGDEYKCRYARSPWSMLASFSNDELSRNNEERQELVANRTQLVHQIEELHRLGENANESALAELRAEYCGLVDFIDPVVDCDVNAKYRTINGKCNNLEYPLRGRSSTPFRRLLNATYEDGVSAPREFPKTAREVSAMFVINDVFESKYFESELLVHLGQFLDHDLNLTPMIRTICSCADDINCISIPCSEDDPVCGTEECIPLPRSQPLLNPGVPCDNGDIDESFLSRIQINGITSYLDASNVYGSHKETADELRTFEDGLLNTTEGADPNNLEHTRLLPPDKENDECVEGADDTKCGKGGDIRAAEQPALTAMHTLFVLEHNRIATQLKQLNPHWDDERLYQESRKIVGALLQRIIYTEWLPLVLGHEFMEQNGLAIWQGYTGYNKSLDASISTDFATSFFRFGHSMVPESLERVTPTYKDKHDDIELRNAFFNATVVHDLGNGGINSIVLGTLERALLKVDRAFSESVHVHLFETAGFGLDLIALNIQRGRDHGLASYLDYRKNIVNDEETYATFEDLKEIMEEDAVDALSEIYSSVDQIEPFVGMLAEQHMEGALVGISIATIIADQFYRLRYGDRFWFENPEGPQAFTTDQLFSINCVTLARVICDNVNVKEIQPSALKQKEDPSPSPCCNNFFYYMVNEFPYPVYNDNGRVEGFTNERRYCNPAYDPYSIPVLDLKPWKELP